MANNKQGTPTVLVTDAGRGSAISIIRSLGRKSWRIVAADQEPGSLGFRSRYTDEKVLYPAPETDPKELVSVLFKAACDYRVDLIIPVTDAVIIPLSEARAQFDGVCKLALPEPDAQEIVTNKLKTLELANRLHVPVPKTCLVTKVNEALEAAETIGWPVVLKPQVSRLYRNHSSIKALTVSYAENSENLMKQMAQFEDLCPVLLQEYYPGTGQGVELLLDKGQPLAVFQHKRIREYPITGGASAFRESVPLDSVLYDYSVRLLEEIKWTGLAMVEFKTGEAGPKLMEINGRVWGSLPLAVHSGMDFPGRLAELYLSGPEANGMKPFSTYTTGVRARNLALDVAWITTVLSGRKRYPFLKSPGRSKGFSALLGLFNPKFKFDILSLEDPRPGLAEVRKITRKLFQKVKESG